MIRPVSQRLLSIIFVWFVVTAGAEAQVASHAPEKPKWGERVTITYNPQAAGAMFSLADDVYLVANFRMDREGRLQYRLSGGSTDVHEKLEPLIRSLLMR